MKGLKQLFCDTHLAVGATVMAPKLLRNRIFKVLRLKQGDQVRLFNGRDGLFLAEICDDGQLRVSRCLEPFSPRKDVVLLVALLKKDNFNNVLRQATEMGVTTIQPVLSAHCVADKLNMERATALMIEAAEQCERIDLPTLKNPIKLPIAAASLAGGGEGAARTVFWCDEVEGGKWGDHVSKAGDAVLIGPEGGFNEEERTWLAAQPHVVRVGLGDLILRADTAVVAALSRFSNAFSAD